MNANQTISVVLMAGAAQGFLLSLVLFTITKANKNANRLLALLLFLFSFMMFFHSLAQLSPTVSEKPNHESLTQLVFFLFGPLFYLYTVALTRKDFHFTWKTILHTLPFFTSIVLFSLLQVGVKNESVASMIDKPLPWLMMIQMSIYLFWVIKVLQQYSRDLKQSHSSVEKINLNWLRFLTVGNLIIWPVAFLVEVMKGDSEAWNYVWLLISIFMYMMGYLGMRQSDIFAGESEDVDFPLEPERAKYKKSTLKPDDAERYFEKLEALMETDKSFLKSDLTLPVLARQIGISVHHLSQVINDKASKNFYEYINSYRVEEAQRLLTDPEKQNLTIAAICYESGFNSLSSFNTLFKKTTGKTPSNFRKNHLKRK
jgi:AraC-like DNA-binding protein